MKKQPGLLSPPKFFEELLVPGTVLGSTMNKKKRVLLSYHTCWKGERQVGMNQKNPGPGVRKPPPLPSLYQQAALEDSHSTKTQNLRGTKEKKFNHSFFRALQSTWSDNVNILGPRCPSLVLHQHKISLIFPSCH
ncbi:hypothetical protein H1C71_023344 [Ictidomys tridecemlineatus]|nr:hypothetical protein H1C71_023344 [Ictidomys tridecemlineatus]